MFLNRAAMVCLAIASVAAAQVSPPTPPRASRGHSVATGVLTKRGFLGVGIMDLTEERAKSLKLADASGVVVRRVDENSPAARAGLRENDVITEVNGQKVDDGEDFIRMIGEISPGNKVSLTLWRDGVKQSVSAPLQARPAHAFVLPDDFPAMP